MESIENLFEVAQKTAQKIDANIKGVQTLVDELDVLLQKYNTLLTDIKTVKL